MKLCTKCSLTKHLSDFCKDSQKKDGVYSSCKDCCSLKDRKRDKRKKSNYDRYYRKSLGWKKVANQLKVEFSFLETLHEVQEGLCAICKNPETSLGSTKIKAKRLAVDHDHITGKIRGLLCQRCNCGLGSFKDNPDLLKGAIEYLRRAS